MAERAPYYRIVFGLAALYNLAFGLWAGFAPYSLFDLFHLRPPLYAAIWSCVGMVVGTYGLAYGYAAVRLDRAAPFIVIWLVGKILGPIGWVLTVRSGEWPVRTFTLILFNDLVWWLPTIGGRLRAVVTILLHAPAKSYLVAVASAVLAARAIAEGRFTPTGLVPPEQHAEAHDLAAYLGSLGIDRVTIRHGRKSA